MSQDTFAKALLNPDMACPQGVCAWNNSDPNKRFSVYRNNVMASLIDALADTFPVSQQLVGDEFFRAMASIWIPENLPISAMLAHYGAAFPDFIAAFEPAQTLPYLADIAKLEWAYVQAFHAADASSVEPKKVAELIANELDLQQVQLTFHPSLATLQSDFAIFSLWAAHQQSEVASLPDPYRSEAALLLRAELQVKVIEINRSEHRLIKELHNNTTLGEAMACALDVQADFDITRILTLLINEGAISTLKMNGKAI